MLHKALAAIMVAALTLGAWHKPYCCAPRHMTHKHVVAHHVHHLVPGQILNVAAITRFTRLGEFRLTAYTGNDPRQGTGDRTALGEKARYGLVAVPRWIPLGTWLYIPGYGVALAADHGSGVHGNHIDLCMGNNTRSLPKAYAWGSRYATVYRIPANYLH